MEANKIVCGFLGHSNKVNENMGKITCSRCEELLVDTWTQAIDPKFEQTLIFLTGGNRQFHEQQYNKKMKELLAAGVT
jgi:hypothetical protein